jgi:hypothetical protein
MVGYTFTATPRVTRKPGRRGTTWLNPSRRGDGHWRPMRHVAVFACLPGRSQMFCLRKNGPLPGDSTAVRRGDDAADLVDLSEERLAAYLRDITTAATAIYAVFEPAQINYLTSATACRTCTRTSCRATLTILRRAYRCNRGWSDQCLKQGF